MYILVITCIFALSLIRGLIVPMKNSELPENYLRGYPETKISENMTLRKKYNHGL